MLKNFNSLLDFQKKFSTQKKCIKYLLELRWNNKPVCQKCFKDDKTYIYKKDGLYGCGHCKREFGIRKNTIFEDSALDLTKWFMAFYLEISNPKGISSCELAKHLKTRQATAWFVLQRIRWALKHKTIEKMQGDIEIDETYCGGKESNKHSSKKTEYSQGGNNKMVVFGMVKRTGSVVLEYIKKSNIKNIKPIIEKNIDVNNSNLFTDESPLYKGFKRETVNHSAKEYVRENAYTNTIENAFSGFKRRLYGIHHQISKKHIDKYSNPYSHYEHQISAVKFLYNFLLNYLYMLEKQNTIYVDNKNYKYSIGFGGGNVYGNFNLLLELSNTIYHEEKLKSHLYFFLNIFIIKTQCGRGTEYLAPKFSSKPEYVQELNKIKTATDKIIKYLQYNKVS